LDLFGEVTIEPLELIQECSQVGKTKILRNSVDIHIFTIDGVKVDIVNYSYPWLEEGWGNEGMRLAGMKETILNSLVY